MTNTIITRALSPTGDPLRGNGLGNFVADIAAVGVILSERLQFIRGNWWENRNAGLPLFQSILGQATTSQAVGLILRKTILATPYVSGIQNITVNYAPDSRAYSFSATVLTQFGPLSITNQNLIA